MNNQSLKSIYDTFEEIASIHKNINDFGKGDIFKINGRPSLKHPTLWVDIDSSDIQNSLIVMKFRIFIMDITDQADLSEEDVHSDTLFIMQDIITLLKKKYELIPDRYDVTTNPFHHKFNDRVAGWSSIIEVRVPYYYAEMDIDFDVDDVIESITE